MLFLVQEKIYTALTSLSSLFTHIFQPKPQYFGLLKFLGEWWGVICRFSKKNKEVKDGKNGKAVKKCKSKCGEQFSKVWFKRGGVRGRKEKIGEERVKKNNIKEKIRRVMGSKVREKGV